MSCLQKISSSFTEARNYSHGQIKRVYQSLSQVHIAQRTEWQKEPSAEWKKEHCRTSVHICQKMWDRATEYSCKFAQRARLTDDKTAFEERDKFNSFWNIGWVHPKRSERQVKFTSVCGKLCASCARSFVRIFHDSRLWRFARIKSFRHLCQKIQKPRVIRKRRIRISVFKRNFKIFRSCRTVIDSRGTLRATTWCWNRRRRRKGKQHRRFVVHEWRIFFRHHEDFRLKFYDPDNETFSIPLTYVNVMRQHQGQCKQVTWNYLSMMIWVEAKGVDLSEECFGTTRFQILRARLLEGNKWVNWRLSKTPENNPAIQYMSWSLDKTIQEPKRKINCKPPWINNGIN